MTGFMGFTKIKGFHEFDHFGTERKNRQLAISDYGFQFHIFSENQTRPNLYALMKVEFKSSENCALGQSTTIVNFYSGQSLKL